MKLCKDIPNCSGSWINFCKSLNQYVESYADPISTRTRFSGCCFWINESWIEL